MENNNKLLIYGCYGYTGSLISELSVAKGYHPTLAGRNEARVKALATKLEVKYAVFDLNNHDDIVKNIRNHDVVIHCAGPFMYTAQQMAKACLSAGVHYIDITGEIAVFEKLQSYDAKAKSAGIMLMPGGGFDVVPSDCLAAHLKSRMADAHYLELALMSDGGGISHGTAITMVENLGQKGAIRKDGKIVVVPHGYKTRKIQFGTKTRMTVTIPWGDISTAYFSTQIPNILVYMATPPKQIKWMKLGNYLSWFLSNKLLINYLKSKIKKREAGPSAEVRKTARSYVWGEARNLNGDRVQSILEAPEGYLLTAHSAVLIASKIMAGTFKIGYQTPSTAYGKDLILEIDGVKISDLDPGIS